nr:RNA-directed DNA polymerase, eukaryota, reverse transcriptase zinc-binding domain protein [Tanacetum cinerariifolium]
MLPRGFRDTAYGKVGARVLVLFRCSVGVQEVAVGKGGLLAGKEVEVLCRLVMGLGYCHFWSFRVQLIRSVLASKHIYWALVFILPTGLMLELEKLMQGFLWCQGEMKKGKAKMSKYPNLGTIDVPHLTNTNDTLEWKDFSNIDVEFSVANVWDCIRPRSDKLKRFTGILNIPSSLDAIVDFLLPLAKMRSVRSVISKLVFDASCYFIWQERNRKLFMKTKRSQDQVIHVIKSTVRLKLLSCRFKKTSRVQTLCGVPVDYCTLFSFSKFFPIGFFLGRFFKEAGLVGCLYSYVAAAR